MKTASTSPYIGCLLRGINNGTATVAVNQFKLRYYFTDEVMKTAQITIGYSQVAIPGRQGDLTGHEHGHEAADAHGDRRHVHRVQLQLG